MSKRTRPAADPKRPRTHTVALKVSRDDLALIDEDRGENLTRSTWLHQALLPVLRRLRRLYGG